MKAIVYSLFGYNKERNENCFDFNSYLRGLMICLRMNRLIYPDFKVIMQTDFETYAGFKHLFDLLIEKELIEVQVNESTELTRAMLWRLKPCFDTRFDYVLCRDLDSPATYREAQAVLYWMNKDKACHSITDSVSHNLPMLGGMIGFKVRNFKDYTGFTEWGAMVDNKGFDYKKKGADQDFLNQFIYPKFAKQGSDSITQHYVLGMPNTFLSDFHNEIQALELEIPFEYKESNNVCGHIGASGWYETAMFKFLRKHWDKFTDLIEIEKEYSNIFYWVNE